MEGQLSALTLVAPSERAITFINTFSRDAHYPIFSCLCDHLPIGGILALSKTCKDFSDIYDYLLPIHWNVDKRLQRFVHDPIGLRSKMGELDALISGSFAIQFFERVTWHSSDLDMYVKAGARAYALRTYLANSEGYTLQTTKGTDDLPYAMRQLTHIWKYTRPIPGSEPEQVTEVHVIATSNNPINAILEGFYSTIVLNFITWNKAYTLCPLTTFIQKRGYLLHESDDYLASLVDKYTQRGWKIQATMTPEDHKVNHTVKAYRRVGDQLTWKIAFDVRNVKCSKTPDTVLERVCFRFRRTSKGDLSLSLRPAL